MKRLKISAVVPESIVRKPRKPSSATAPIMVIVSHLP